MRDLEVQPAAGIAVLHELAADVTVVDVSAAAAPLDREALGLLGDVVLVCFGSHGHSRCPLNGTASQDRATHGVVLDIGLRPDHHAFLRGFRRLVRPDVPINVTNSRADGAAS